MPGGVTAAALCVSFAVLAQGAAELSGWWIPDSAHPIGCRSDLGIEYRPDGTYRMLEESGTWKLEGGTLTQTATQAHEAAEPGAVKIGQPLASRIHWSGPDAFTRTFPGGKAITFRRCPISRPSR